MDVITSPEERDIAEIPNVDLAEYILTKVRQNVHKLGSQPWLVDTTSGNVVKFCDIDDHSRRIASALARQGFKKGDVFYFVTYEMANVFLLHLAVWRLGGTMRGWHQQEGVDLYSQQIQETRARYVLIDADTAPLLQEAAKCVEWKIHWVNVGDREVPGCIPFEVLLKDDGTAFPAKVEINPHVDVAIIPSTSGSTGKPKGVLKTHYNMVAALHEKSTFVVSGRSVMSSMVNFSGANILLTISSACDGITVYFIGKLKKESYFDLLTEYKPENIVMYPYFAGWFARCKELATVDLSFLRGMCITAWILDPSTVSHLSTRLPHVHLVQLYGMTECSVITTTELRKDITKPMVVVKNQGELCVSTGRLMPYVKAKIVDINTGKTLPPGERGEILIQAPSLMKGYLNPGQQEPNRSEIEEGGWFHTRDLGFFDEDGNIFVNERINFMYKYKTVPVLPSEIEAVLQEHPAVLGAGVVGVPNPETDNLSRAFVVLRPESAVTSKVLEQWVAERLPEHKWLHGGVRFVDQLPENRAGKLDRATLKKMTLAEH